MIRHAFTLAAATLLATSTSFAQEGPPLKTAVDGTFAPHAMPKLGGGYEGFNIDLAERDRQAHEAQGYDRRRAVLRHRAGAAGRHLRFRRGADHGDQRARRQHAVHRRLSQHRLPVPDQEGRAEGQQARRPEGQDRLGEQGLGLRLLGARPRSQDRLEGGELRHADRRRAGGARRPRRRQRRRQHRDRLGGEEQSAARTVLPALDRPRLGARRCARIPASCASRSRTRSSA